jgi:hypothetical protein
MYWLVVVDRAVVGDAHRLCGDGHGARRQGGGEQGDGQHDITLRLPHTGRPLQPAGRAHLRRRLRLVQKHLPRGEHPRHPHAILAGQSESRAQWHLSSSNLKGLRKIIEPTKNFSKVYKNTKSIRKVSVKFIEQGLIFTF